MRTKIGFFTVKIVCLAFILGALLVPLQAGFVHGAEGIALEKDVFLQNPILGVEDLPDAVTFALYASESATTPLATQTFARGKYILDFEFNKSDGVALGPIARLKVDFTNKLNMGDDPDNPTRVTEIWSEVKVNGQAIGDRTKVTDEAMVKLLLASDASIATYLTLVYEGDSNPIATIYRDLPLASSSRSSANEYITSLFSAYSTTDRPLGSLSSPYWDQSGSNIYYNDGYVGIGTNLPDKALVLYQTSNAAFRLQNATTGVGGGFKGVLFEADELNFHFWNYGNGFLRFGTNNEERIRITADGKMGIGTTSPSYNLAVNGTIGCKEVTVTSTGWADFVFKDNYKLPPLSEVEAYISTNKHLPGIPTEAEVKEKGISVGDMSSKLLQKIEEITLYVIDLKKENESLRAQLTAFQEQLESQRN